MFIVQLSNNRWGDSKQTPASTNGVVSHEDYFCNAVGILGALRTDTKHMPSPLMRLSCNCLPLLIFLLKQQRK